jgi:hypothetical protein
VNLVNRRSFLVAIPQVALTAACAFGAARVSTSTPTDAKSHGDTGSEPQPPDADLPATHEQEAAPRRVQPLPMPQEDDRSWLQEWLDLISLTGRQASSGC